MDDSEENPLSLGEILAYKHKHEAIVDCADLDVWRTWPEPYTESDILKLAGDLLNIVCQGREFGEGWLDRHLATVCFYRNSDMAYEPISLCGCYVCERYREYFDKQQFQREQRMIAQREERLKRKLPRGARRRILARDLYACLFCGAQSDLTIDHRVPLAKGGTNEDSNLQALCRSCNCRKGAK